MTEPIKTGKEIVLVWKDEIKEGTPIAYILLERIIDTELRKVLEICRPIRDYLQKYSFRFEAQRTFVDMVNQLKELKP
jgi:hypothetical protein